MTNAAADETDAPRLSDKSYHAARDRVVAEFERAYLSELIERAGGNMSEAARIAGVDRTTLYRLMERHSIRPVRTLKVESR